MSYLVCSHPPAQDGCHFFNYQITSIARTVMIHIFSDFWEIGGSRIFALFEKNLKKV